MADPARLVREQMPATRMTPEAFAGWLAGIERPAIAGNGATRYRAQLSAAHCVDVTGPSAVSVGRLALGQRARGETADFERAVPFYGRPPDITVKKGT